MSGQIASKTHVELQWYDDSKALRMGLFPLQGAILLREAGNDCSLQYAGDSKKYLLATSYKATKDFLIQVGDGI